MDAEGRVRKRLSYYFYWRWNLGIFGHHFLLERKKEGWNMNHLHTYRVPICGRKTFFFYRQIRSGKIHLPWSWKDGTRKFGSFRVIVPTNLLHASLPFERHDTLFINVPQASASVPDENTDRKTLYLFE